MRFFVVYLCVVLNVKIKLSLQDGELKRENLYLSINTVNPSPFSTQNVSHCTSFSSSSFHYTSSYIQLLHPGLYCVSHLISVIILPPDAEIFMPSNCNLAFNKRCNGPDLRFTEKADVTLLAGLMYRDKHTEAITTAGNHNRNNYTTNLTAVGGFSACVCDCMCLICRKGTLKLRISAIINQSGCQSVQ